MLIDRHGPFTRIVFGLGKVAFDGRPDDLDCVVWGTTDTGATIEVDPQIALPYTVRLRVEGYAFDRLCVVVWRQGRKLGLDYAC
ncbi:pilus assembly protein PilZ [Methylobacterium durans]|uniref:Pilus assembly protein PilZ n=1 Tax=Methylobacterium durans TaxID=2202825 RepID=A0A2U8W9Y8_9HYPH|nr:pilus assembly protein PilZ [Methylobacterium durans]AWN42954.1 pilus assembly protein PilZ [Methylobacterium durans]MEA1833175.1 pilus assembly protein PilZ [Methylobacterium durans]